MIIARPTCRRKDDFFPSHILIRSTRSVRDYRGFFKTSPFFLKHHLIAGSLPRYLTRCSLMHRNGIVDLCYVLHFDTFRDKFILFVHFLFVIEVFSFFSIILLIFHFFFLLKYSMLKICLQKN